MCFLFIENLHQDIDNNKIHKKNIQIKEINLHIHITFVEALSHADRSRIQSTLNAMLFI